MALIKSTLSEVCKLVTDGTHDTPKTIPHGYPLIKAKEIVGGVIDFKNSSFISKEDHLRVISRSHPEKGDTLFAHIGASLGEAAYINSDIEFSIKNIALFKPDSEKIDGRYLYYLTISPPFQALAKGARTGSAQPFLSLGHLRSHKIVYESVLKKQKKISSILSAYDDLIENNQRRIRVLEEMAQSLYREWFVHFRYPGRENVSFADSVLGPIPEGWEIKKLGDCVSFIKETTKTQKLYPELRYLPIDCLPRVSIAVNEVRPLEEAKSSLILFKENDILFGAMRPYFHKVAFAPFDGVTRSTCFVFRPLKEELHSWTLLRLFQSETVNFANARSKGATIPYASWEDGMAKMPCIFPDESIAEQFHSLVSPMINWIKQAYFWNKNLQATRDMLLPKLISGEIEISDAIMPKEDAA